MAQGVCHLKSLKYKCKTADQPPHIGSVFSLSQWFSGWMDVEGSCEDHSGC